MLSIGILYIVGVAKRFSMENKLGAPHVDLLICFNRSLVFN